MIYGQFVVMTSRNARFQLIKKQLILVGRLQYMPNASGAQYSTSDTLNAANHVCHNFIERFY